MEQFKSAIAADLTDREKREAAAREALDPAAYPNLFPERWSDFRRSRLTSLVIKIRTAVKTARPGALVSAAVVPDAEQAFASRLQDWRGWIDQSLLDVHLPDGLHDRIGDVPEADRRRARLCRLATGVGGHRRVSDGAGANADAHRRGQQARRRRASSSFRTNR